MQYFVEAEAFFKQRQAKLGKEKAENDAARKKEESTRVETQKERVKKWGAAEDSYRRTNRFMMDTARNLETQAERNYNIPTERKWRSCSSGWGPWRKTWSEPYICDAKQKAGR